MKRTITTTMFFMLAFLAMNAQNDVKVNATDAWKGFMNVFELPENGSGYAFGSEWALDAIKTTLDTNANTIVLQPNFNTYADGMSDPYWVDQTTLEGNKFMEAISLVEPGEAFNGDDLTFSGDVLSHTLDTNYTAWFFIKALDPNNNFADVFEGAKVLELPTSGSFSVDASAADLAAGLLIQYGFIVTGTNANPANEDTLGNVTVGVLTSSASELTKESDAISVSPNPAIDQLMINATSEVQSFNIISLSGQLIMSGGNGNLIDVSNLTPGMYLLNAQLEDRREVIKFMKQ
jgi:hypothetical protein